LLQSVGTPRAIAGRTIQVRPFSPALGGEVRGIDLANGIDEESYREIRQAFCQFGVLFFKGQSEMPPAVQIAIGRMFGALHTHPAAPQMEGFPELFVIHTQRDSKVANGEFWHSDVSCDEEPPLGTMLQIHLLPDIGGDTLFANMPPDDAVRASAAAAHRFDRVSRVEARLPRPLRRSGRGRSQQGLSESDTSGDPYASGNRPQGPLREPDVHDPHQRAERSGKRRRARIPLRPLGTDRFPDPLQMGAERRRLLGQPLCDAPRGLGLLAERAQGAARHNQGRAAALTDRAVVNRDQIPR
jgi:hypothetical protein